MSLAELFAQEITLENEQVRLEPLTIKHLDALATVGLHADIWKFTLDKIENKADLKKYLQTAIAEREAKKSYPFAIFDKKKNQYAGCTRYYDILVPHKCLEIGYTWIGKNFQGSGLNKACKYELLKFAFESLKVNRVALRTDYLNHQSRNAIMKIGGKQEGILRKHRITPSGRVRDTVYFSIIAEEWELIRKTIFALFL